MPDDLRDVLAATWPAAEMREEAGFLLRRGEGGGRRASAALLLAPDGAIEAAEAVMRGWGQAPAFQIWSGHDRLDAALADRGYALAAPSVLFVAPTGALALDQCDLRTIYCEAILACMTEIWAEGGVGPERLAVMRRTPGPRIWLLGRHGDRAAGCAHVAVSGETVMLHALHVAEPARRHGLGMRLVQAAATWGRRRGARRLALAVERSNTGAVSLCAGLGLTEAAQYHYRVRA